jgi:transposase-like protein
LTEPLSVARDVLTQVLRDSAQQLLAQAIESEVADWMAMYGHLKDGEGRQAIVRNGYLPERRVTTGIGPVRVRQPRVRDRRPQKDQTLTFHSRILPRYLRKTRSVEDLVPWLYLRGISTGQVGDALQALIGANPAGFSASTVTRLIATWQKDYEAWSQRSLADKHYVYIWADGVYFNVRLEDAENAKQCILVVMGATADGTKELIAVQDGYRESTSSWVQLLRDCRQRGLKVDPHLAIGDGGLGFWSALPQVYPSTRGQRCWVHKMANVLNKLPKGVQGRAKSKLREIYTAESREEADKALDHFVNSFQAKYPKAAACLEKDREALLAFYDFPAEHWVHLRTTNPIESAFATVRLRHNRTKGNGSRAACLAMVFKLCQAAESHWRGLNGSDLLPAIIAGITFENGIQTCAA